MKFCTKCGNELRPDSNFCDKCGTPVPKNKTNDTSKSKQSSNEEKSKYQSSNLGYAIFFVIILITVIFMIFSNLLEKSTNQYSTSDGALYKKDKYISSVKYRKKKYVYNKINIRSGRGTNFKIIGRLNRGDVVEVDSLKNGWFIVYKNGIKQGYVYSNLLKDEPIPNILDPLILRQS